MTCSVVSHGEANKINQRWRDVVPYNVLCTNTETSAPQYFLVENIMVSNYMLFNELWGIPLETLS